MHILTTIILITFFILRNSFTLLKGKRKIKHITSFVYIGRKLIEVVICILIPLLILTGFIDKNISETIYYFGVVVSIVGLIFMTWTRLRRDRDWGFMGDDSGSSLFIDGPYKYTRHPYYVGAIFVGVGLYLQLNYILVILMLPVMLFIVFIIRREEQFLTDHFGKKFLDYKSKVGIFPWWYPF